MQENLVFISTNIAPLQFPFEFEYLSETKHSNDIEGLYVMQKLQ